MDPCSTITLSPPLTEWFKQTFRTPTDVQVRAWTQIAAGEHCLISAGTGQGKTLAALLPLLDRRLQQSAGAQTGMILYLSPLRALAVNLQAGLSELLQFLPWPGGGLQIAVRSGDTTMAERRRQLQQPPDLLLTTPESLFILLGSHRGRVLLARVSAVVIDELHVYLDSKRGAHLALSLERLERLRGNLGLQRIGLSATICPADLGARFLAGPGRHCALVTCSDHKAIDLVVEQGDTPLLPQADGPRWGFVLKRLAEIVEQAERTLVFCNTRAQVERVAMRLGERLGPERVAAHHGSLGASQRAGTEAALRSGTVSVVVCSASLELGIDIGPLDRVCQIGAINRVNLMRQRAGRSGHGPGRRPCLHVFPLNQADGLDLLALQDALNDQAIERGRMPNPYLDVLSQQIVALLGEGLDTEAEILALVQQSGPWQQFSEARLSALTQTLHDGFVGGREVGRGPLVKLGGGRLKACQDAALLSRLNAGTLPEWFDYRLIDADSGAELGRLDEEFAFESVPGQAIHLGGESFRIVSKGTQHVRVRRDPEAEAELPFWLGEGSGRSSLLSGYLRRRLMAFGTRGSGREANDMLALALSQLGVLPNERTIVLERFFDPGGDEHVVLHSLFGQRLNRAWGLALRKRFCRNFNFELQAAVTDNAILISLGATHSFALDQVIGFLNSSSLREVLIQAVLDTPQFIMRLRWCANIALAVPRRLSSGMVPAQIQRNQAENLIARVFPDQLACLENLSGPRRVPDHPLIEQALTDCLDEFMDTCGLERLYRNIESGRIRIHCCDTDQPSILAQAVIQAPRTAYLDPAAAEERRTRSFEAPSRFSGKAYGRSKPASERPLGTADELEQALLEFVYLPAAEAARRQAQWAFSALRTAAVAVALWPKPKCCVWVHVDCLSVWLCAAPSARLEPSLPQGLRPGIEINEEEALCRITLGAVRRLGRAAAAKLATETGLPEASLAAALRRLECEGLLCAREEAGWFSERGPTSGPHQTQSLQSIA